MKAKLFQLVWHAREGAKNEPILSLDFHPRLPLLATAGMDNTVRLWRVREPHQVQAPTAADDGSRGAGTGAGAAPRATVTGAGVGGRPGDVGSAYVEFLYTLSQHAASVNVVRWSPAGDALASAGDEAGVVVVWRPKAGFTWETALTEKNLAYSHAICAFAKNEVYDLAWSPDGRYIAAAFVNSAAAAVLEVEGAHPAGAPSGSSSAGKRWVGVLGGHAQLVQGVAWDPANAYVATESNDRTVRIYRNPAALLPAPAGGAAGRGGKKGAEGSGGGQLSGAKRDRASMGGAGGSGGGATGDARDWPLVAVLRNREAPAAEAAEGAPSSSSASSAAASAAAGTSPTPSAPSSAPSGAPHPLFLDEGVPSFFRRPAWTPDGSLLLAPTGLFRGSMALPTGAGAPSALAALSAAAGDGASASAASSAAASPHGSSAAAAAGAAAGGSVRYVPDVRPTTYAWVRDRFGAPAAHFPGTRQSKASVVVKASPVLYKLRGAAYPLVATPAAPAPAALPGAAAAAEGAEEAAASSSSSSSSEQSTAAPVAAAEGAAEGLASSGSSIGSTTSSGSGSSSAEAFPPLSAVSAAHGAGHAPLALPYRMLIAIATLDAVHVYDTQQAAPLVTLAGFHLDRITDIAWSPSGNMLFVASWDGYVSCAAFAPGELGEPLPPHLLPPLVAQRREAVERAFQAQLAAAAAGAGAGAAAAAGAGAAKQAVAAATVTPAGAGVGVATLQPRKRIAPLVSAGSEAGAGSAQKPPAPAAAQYVDHRVSMAGGLPPDPAPSGASIASAVGPEAGPVWPPASPASSAAAAFSQAAAAPGSSNRSNASSSGGGGGVAAAEGGGLVSSCPTQLVEAALPSMLSVAATMASPPRTANRAAAAAAAPGSAGPGSANRSPGRRRIAPAPVASLLKAVEEQAEAAAGAAAGHHAASNGAEATLPPADGAAAAPEPSPKRPRTQE